MNIKITRNILLSSTALSMLLTGCASTNALHAEHFKVEQFGEMRKVMREGQTQARFPLSDAAQPGMIAVGALEGLAGEITVFDGQVWSSRVNNAQMQLTGPHPRPQDQATLLTVSHVNEWISIPIQASLEKTALESFIEHAAQSKGIDTTQPFPFVIKGQLEHIDLHVINGYCPIATDPATVDAQPWKWSSDQSQSVTIVGFFAPNAAGVMTHHGTSIHAHALIKSPMVKLAGHIDSVRIEPGMTLHIPKQ